MATDRELVEALEKDLMNMDPELIRSFLGEVDPEYLSDVTPSVLDAMFRKMEES